MQGSSALPTRQRSGGLGKLLRDERVIRYGGQFIFTLLLSMAVIGIAISVFISLDSRGLTPTFTFLSENASFGIAGASNYYNPATDSFLRAFFVGVENTLRVVSLGLVLATLIGILFGIFLLSSNFLVRSIARVYVEALRNTPLLVQLFVWYFIFVLALPGNANAVDVQVGGESLLVISNGGIRFLDFVPTPRFPVWGVSIVLGLALALDLWNRNTARMKADETLKVPRLFYSLTAAAVVIAAGWVVAIVTAPPLPETVALIRNENAIEDLAERPIDLDYTVTENGILVNLEDAKANDVLTFDEQIQYAPTPYTIIFPQRIERQVGTRVRVNYDGGAWLTPEFIAMLLALVIYTSAFIAEIVRAGIQSVNRGQLEAARALGLTRPQTLRRIILPQALRLIIPPMGNQYLNLAKNSSLGIAIAFPDLFQVSNTIINQRNQTLSTFVLIMAAYLTMSLSISFVMNRVNGRFQLVTR